MGERSVQAQAVETMFSALRRTERKTPTVDLFACVACGDDLPWLSDAEKVDPVVMEFGRLCERCYELQEDVR